MVFSPWIMGIICLFASTSAQEVTSSLPASNRTCPGTRIAFNCSIAGSVSLTNLIIAWGSPEYIGQGSLLQFTTANMIGDNRTSMINDDVIAQLVYNGDRNGTPTLESQLQLTASSNFTNPTITCQSFPSGAMRNITFYILSIPGLLLNAKGTEVRQVDGRCELFLMWDAPLNYDEKDIDHYFVKDPDEVIQTMEKSTFVSFNMPHCIPDLNVNISAVDRCSREGPNTSIVVQLDPSQVTTPQENQSGPDEVAVIAIVIAVIASILTVLFAILLVILFCYFRKRLKDYPQLRDRGDIALQKLPTNLSKRLLTLCKEGCTAEVGDFKSLLDQGADPNIHDDEYGCHPLWYASFYSKRDLVELFLQYKADVNLKTKYGQTPLHHASSSGHTGVVKLLVDSGAQIDNKDKDGQTALHLAYKSGHTDVVKLLVDSGAKIDNKDKYGWTALHLASNNGHTDVVKLLVDSGAQTDNKNGDGQTALHLASISGHTDVVKLLVDSGAKIDNKNKDGWTALYLASYSSHTGVIKLLVDSGAQIDNKNKSKQLLKLCKDGCTAEVGVFKSLLDQGADPNMQDKYGCHPLWYASRYGKRDLIELFLQYKADVNLKTKYGQTALHLASYSGHTGVVELLVDCGAKIDNEDKYGWTALYIASRSGHTDVVKLLVDSGANINHKNKYGQTALHLASISGHTNVVKLLVDSGAQIDNKDKYGWTALHIASISGHTNVVKLLVDSGAQIDNKDNDGQTALERAAYSSHTDVVNLLTDSGSQLVSEDNPFQIVEAD